MSEDVSVLAETETDEIKVVVESVIPENILNIETPSQIDTILENEPKNDENILKSPSDSEQNVLPKQVDESEIKSEDQSVSTDQKLSQTNGEETPKGRSLRQRPKTKHYELDSDDEALIEKSPPKLKKSKRYYSDDEYVPGKISDKEQSLDEDEQDPELESPSKKRKKGRPRKADSPRKKSVSSVESRPKSPQFLGNNGEVVVVTDELNDNNGDIENNIGRSVISAGDKFKVTPKQASTSKCTPKSAMGAAFEDFVSNIGSKELQVKKLPNAKETSQESLLIPTLSLPELNLKVDASIQTETKKLAHSYVQTSSSYAITHKETATFSEDQCTNACAFMANILKTTTELGHLMTSKADEFIEKKVNATQMKTTANLEYCIKKAFLLFKLAKDNLTTMEETLEQQYESFIRTHNLAESFEIEQKITPTATEQDDSDCEIVGETPAPPPPPKKTAAKKLQLNKELSIKITKKPEKSKPKPNSKQINLPGRHAVWINNSIMVKKVKSNQSFLAQDSRTKKPPDNDLLVICNDFFKTYECNYMKRKYCEPYIHLDCQNFKYHSEITCNYFTTVTESKYATTNSEMNESNLNEVYSEDSFGYDSNSDSLDNYGSSQYANGLEQFNFNPKTLFTICIEYFNKDVSKQNAVTETPESSQPRLFDCAVENFWKFFQMSLKNSKLEETKNFLKPLKSLSFEKVAAFLARAVQTRQQSSALQIDSVSSLKHLCFIQINSLINGCNQQESRLQHFRFGNSKGPLKLSQCCVTTMIQQLLQSDEFQALASNGNIDNVIKLPDMSYEDINYCLRKTFNDFFRENTKIQEELNCSDFVYANAPSLFALSLRKINCLMQNNSTTKTEGGKTFLEEEMGLQLEENFLCLNEPEIISVMSLAQPRSLFSSCIALINNILYQDEGTLITKNLHKLKSLKALSLDTINELLFPYDYYSDEEANDSNALPVITGITTLNEQEDEDPMPASDQEYYDDSNDAEFLDCNSDLLNTSTVINTKQRIANIQFEELPFTIANIKTEPQEIMLPLLTSVKTEAVDEYMVNIHIENKEDDIDPIRFMKQELSDQYVSPHLSASAPDFEAFEQTCNPRVRREYDPDSDEEVIPDSLLIPVSTGKGLQAAKGQLLASSESDEDKNKSKDSNQLKKRYKKKKAKTFQKQTEDIDKPKDKDESEISILTRKMRQKLQNDQSKATKSDSEDEYLYFFPKSVDNAHESDKKKQETEKSSKIKDLEKPTKKKKETTEEYVPPILNDYTKKILQHLKNTTPQELQQLENELLADPNFNSLSRSEMKKYINQKLVEIRDLNTILSVKETDAKPLENKTDKTTSLQRKLRDKNTQKTKLIESPLSVESQVLEKPQAYETRDGWDLYKATPGDTKLYCPPNVVLEKLPETFVKIYFEYIQTFNADQRQIDRLTNLKSLHRKTSDVPSSTGAKVNSTKGDVKLKKGKDPQNLSVGDDAFSEAEDSDRDYSEILGFDEPSSNNNETEAIENSLARRNLMADSNSESDKSEAESSNVTTEEPKSKKLKKAIEIKQSDVTVKVEPVDDSENIEIEVKIEYDDDGNQITTQVNGQKVVRKRLPGPKSKMRFNNVPMNPKDLVLTAETTMKDNLDRLHAPVNFGSEQDTATKEKKKVNPPREKKIRDKTEAKTNPDSGSDEEEKQWLTTKEKLLTKMQRKHERTMKNQADDAKGTEMVKSFIVKRNNMPFQGRRFSRKQRLKMLQQLDEEREQQAQGDTVTKDTMKKGSSSYFRGRKNIKKVIDKTLLARSTVLANKEEHERKQRLAAIRVKLRSMFGLDDSINVFIINGELCLEFDMVNCKPIVSVDRHLTEVMKPHQYEGVKFMWDACFESVQRSEDPGGGCILAHCMGLGKTLQVIALLHTILSRPNLKTKRVLVCCPLSTVLNWVDEIQHWLAPVSHNIKVFELSKLKKLYERAYQLDDWYKEGGIFILGYEMFRSLASLDPLIDQVRPTIVYKIRNALVEPGPDLVICDEGHLLKNESSALALSMSQIQTKRRIVLTGTPMQNNLREYYCMVNFVKPNLLGTYREYVNRFEDPIMNGQHRDSSQEDIKLMRARSHILHKVLEGCLQRLEASVLYPYLPTKHEFVLFVALTKCQIELYKHYLTHYGKKMGTFKDFHVLQKIWTHPRALHLFYTTFTSVKKECPEEAETKQAAMSGEHAENWWLNYLNSDQALENLNSSNKFRVVFEILNQCTKIGDKLLIFSSSLYTLNSLEYFLQKIKNWTLGRHYFRIDGSVPLEIRQKWCKEFNSESNKITKLFLISTRAGCLGVNLTGANRVIILDTSWNPAHDIQSIFRVYRFGQKKDCFIYRVVAKGTMEQKIYERSVTKQAVSCRVVDEQQIDRHYNSEDLTALYNFDEDAAMERVDDSTNWSCTAEKDHVLVTLQKKLGPSVLRGLALHDSLLRHMCEQQLDEDERAAAWRQFRMEEWQRSNGVKKKMTSKSLQIHDDTNMDPTILGADVNVTDRSQMKKLMKIMKKQEQCNSAEESILPDIETSNDIITPDTTNKKKTKPSKSIEDLFKRIKTTKRLLAQTAVGMLKNVDEPPLDPDDPDYTPKNTKKVKRKISKVHEPDPANLLPQDCEQEVSILPDSGEVNDVAPLANRSLEILEKQIEEEDDVIILDTPQPGKSVNRTPVQVASSKPKKSSLTPHKISEDTVTSTTPNILSKPSLNKLQALPKIVKIPNVQLPAGMEITGNSLDNIKHLLPANLLDSILASAGNQKIVVINVNNQQGNSRPAEDNRAPIANPEKPKTSVQREPVTKKYQTIDISDDETESTAVPVTKRVKVSKSQTVLPKLAPKPTIKRVNQGSENIALHPALFQNPFFEKIIRQEMLEKLNSTEAEANAAAKQLMLVLMKQTTPVTEGVVYDIAVAKLGLILIKSLWKMTHSDVANIELRTKKMTTTRTEPSVSQPSVSQNQRQNQPTKEVVPVGLISNMAPTDRPQPIGLVKRGSAYATESTHTTNIRNSSQITNIPISNKTPVEESITSDPGTSSTLTAANKTAQQEKRIKMKISTKDTNNIHIVETSTAIAVDSDSDTESEPLKSNDYYQKLSSQTDPLDILKNVVLIKAPEEEKQTNKANSIASKSPAKTTGANSVADKSQRGKSNVGTYLVNHAMNKSNINKKQTPSPMLSTKTPSTSQTQLNLKRKIELPPDVAIKSLRSSNISKPTPVSPKASTSKIVRTHPRASTSRPSNTRPSTSRSSTLRNSTKSKTVSLEDFNLDDIVELD